MALKVYRTKRKFDVTSEPRGRVARGDGGDQYVIQKHAATRLHYDLRLELDGVMKSWAVTRGPSLVPGEKRLAVHVEDHPVEYNTFEGTIPKGQYGGGTVMVWDLGTWHPEFDAHKGYQKGHLEFTLDGQKLKGRWHLVRMRKRQGERQEPWLLIKAEDAEARGPRDPDILETEARSALTGRSMEEIADGLAPRKSAARGRDPAPKAAKAPKSAKSAKAAKTTKAVAKKPAAATGKGTARKRAKLRAATAAADVVREAGVRARRPAGRAVLPPDFVPPCLATLADHAPSEAGWVHEIKFDGYRIQARLVGGKARLRTRKGLDWTGKFQPVADALAELPARSALIDGEIVVQDVDGRSNFSLLQADLSGQRTDRFVYFAFDLLHLDGSDVSKLPLAARKTALKNLLTATGGPVKYGEHVTEPGSVVLRHACKMKLEGIVSKRADAPYHSGRSGDWLKIKCHNRQEFVVAGYGPSTVSDRMIGSLVLGYYDGGRFRYAGRVGTGYTQSVARDLWKRLNPLRTDGPPFDKLPEEERRRDVRWVEPQLVVEIDFGGFTADGILRHSAFKGLREDKPAREVVRELPAATAESAAEEDMAKTTKPARRKSATAARAAKTATTATTAKKSIVKTPVAPAGVRLSHPDRVYWEDVGITKAALADYYSDIWPRMAPHVAGRPLALLRCPDGIAGQCFMQKHAHATFNQGGIRRFKDGSEELIAIDGLDGAIALVQAGVLEIHVWGSTVAKIDVCDRLVFDFDPGPGVPWSAVIAGARELRERLRGLKLTSFVKTTGGKGLHVMVPITGTDWDTAKTFSHAIALAMEKNAPDRYVANMSKSKRKGVIFVDYLRNGRGATAVAAYSPRARPGAAVSTPIDWDELGPRMTADRFTILNLRQRLSRLRGDPWAEVPKVRQKLPG